MENNKRAISIEVVQNIASEKAISEINDVLTFERLFDYTAVRVSQRRFKFFTKDGSQDKTAEVYSKLFLDESRTHYEEEIASFFSDMISNSLFVIAYESRKGIKWMKYTTSEFCFWTYIEYPETEMERDKFKDFLNKHIDTKDACIYIKLVER